MAGSFDLQYKQIVSGAIVGLVLAFVGVDGYRGVVNPRPDPFTGTDGLLLKHDILDQCKAYTDNKFVEHWGLIPPIWTRVRLIHVEDFIHNTHPEFRRQTEKW